MIKHQTVGEIYCGDVWHINSESRENIAEGQYWRPSDLEMVAATLWQSQKVQHWAAKGFGVLKYIVIERDLPWDDPAHHVLPSPCCSMRKHVQFLSLRVAGAERGAETPSPLSRKSFQVFCSSRLWQSGVLIGWQNFTLGADQNKLSLIQLLPFRQRKELCEAV